MCEILEQKGINWKKGELIGFDAAGIKGLPLNYFSCGKYYFDGFANVVEFPAGMSLYHGSSGLKKANCNFPIGANFYTPMSSVPKFLPTFLPTKHTKGSIENALTQIRPITQSWYADYKTAKLYGAPDQIFAYVTIAPLKMMVLDDDFNILRILKNTSVSEQVKENLLKMFTLPSDVKAVYAEKYGKIRLSAPKIRRSVSTWDKSFAGAICPFDYVGYCANVQIVRSRPEFHLEFVFCNPLESIKRDLSNPRDWQHNSIVPSNANITRYLDQLKMYTNFNVAFQAGNLIEHTVWSVLHTESMLSRYIGGVYSYENQYENSKIINPLASTIALLHRIGEMDPENCTVRKSDVLYDAAVNHVETGVAYLSKTKNIPVLDSDMAIVGSINIDNLLSALKVDKKQLGMIIGICGSYSKLEENMEEYLESGESERVVDKYINLIGDKPFSYYYILLVVSMADILARQPFISSDPINVKSSVFPWISNMAKRYPGSIIPATVKISLEKFATSVLNKVYDNQYGSPIQGAQVDFDRLRKEEQAGAIRKHKIDTAEIEELNDNIKEGEKAVEENQRELLKHRADREKERAVLVEKLAKLDMGEEVFIDNIHAIDDIIDKNKQKVNEIEMGAIGGLDQALVAGVEAGAVGGVEAGAVGGVEAGAVGGVEAGAVGGVEAPVLWTPPADSDDDFSSESERFTPSSSESEDSD